MHSLSISQLRSYTAAIHHNNDARAETSCRFVASKEVLQSIAWGGHNNMHEDLLPAEFVAQRAAGELWQLLDVRESWEIATACVPEFIHIPMSEMLARRDELDEQTPVAVLCHSGLRSARVATYLAATGFARVANIRGGIDAWAKTVDTTIPRY